MRASPENGIPRSETPLLGDISEHYLHQATLPPGTNAMTLVTTMQQIYQKIEQKQKIILVIAYPDKPPDQSIATTEETINKNIVYVVKKHFFRRVDGKIVTFDENGDTHTMGEIINDAYANNRTVFFELIDYNAVPALLTEFASPKKQITNEEKVSEKKPSKIHLGSNILYHGQLLRDIPYKKRRQHYLDKGLTIKDWVFIELIFRDASHQEILEITGIKRSNIYNTITRIEEKLAGRLSD